MLPTIGKGPRTSGARGVVPRLLDCHDRIRRHLAIGERLGGAEGAPDEQVAQAAAQLIGYFGRSLPHHSADEDESIAPRLRVAAADLGGALDTMAEQHRAIERRLADLLAACEAVAHAPGERARHREQIASAVRDLHSLFAVHLELEETVIFPRIEHLDAAEQQAIVDEMIARRQP